MTSGSHLSIWFFVGILLAFYGLIITGAGIYGGLSLRRCTLPSTTPTSGGGFSCWPSGFSTAITSHREKPRRGESVYRSCRWPRGGFQRTHTT